MPPLPPDRSHVSTEQRHLAVQRDGLDERASADLVSLIATAQARALETVNTAAEVIGAFVDDVARRDGRLIYLGAGTSGRLGVLDASECPPTFGSNPGDVVGLIAGGDAALRVSSEGTEDDPAGALSDLDALQVGPPDAVLGISAGGTTPWVLGAIECATERGALTGLLTCARLAVPTRPPGCDHCIVLDTGPELLAGSTRLAAGTATKAALNAISTALYVRRGAVFGDLMIDLRATNDKLLDRAIRMLRLFRPTLDRQGAADLVLAADGQLKTAIVCALGEVDPETARASLDAAGGQLRSVIVADRLST